MNARQAAEQGAQLVKELLEGAISMSKRNGKTVNECIDYKVNLYVRRAKTTTESTAWEIRGEEAKKALKKEEDFKATKSPKTTTYLYQDVELELEVTHYEFEPQTRDYEGMPEHYVIEKVYLKEVDITHLVNAEEIERDFNDKMIG